MSFTRLRDFLKSEPDDPTEADRGFVEKNLCIAFADHDACPYREIDEHGVLVFCNCPCHLDPEASP